VVGLFSYLDEDGHQELHCTGTLISPRVVLTSAECVYRHDTCGGGGGRFLDLVGFTVLRTSDSTDHERQLAIAMQTTHALVVRAVVPRGWIRHRVCVYLRTCFKNQLLPDECCAKAVGFTELTC
jgi:hypothetical protein